MFSHRIFRSAALIVLSACTAFAQTAAKTAPAKTPGKTSGRTRLRTPKERRPSLKPRLS